MTDEELMQEFPDLPWLKALEITVYGHGGQTYRYCCRFCIARHGIRGQDVENKGFQTKELFKQHLKEVHGFKI